MLTRLLNIPETLDLFLFGPRATGKTTLLAQQFEKNKDIFIFDLLDETILEQFQNSPKAFKEALLALPINISTIIVDEIQKAPFLLNTIQEFIYKKKFRFILTGSSARKLKRGHANLLGGRAVTRTLWPLCSLEIPDTPNNIIKKLQWGGLPKVFLANNDTERADLLRAYVQTYLTEEIIAEQLVRNLVPFRKFLQVAAQMNGKIINTNSIARDIGTSHNTVASYFEILEDTLIGFSLPAYESSIRKRVRSKAKFYLFDTGVYRALSRTLDIIPQMGTSYYGDLFEHMIITEFKTLCSYFKPDWELFFLQTTSNGEIDLIIDKGNSELIAIEIKSTSNISNISLAKELSLLQDFNATKTYILSQDIIPKILAPNIKALFWKEGLREIMGLV